MTPSAAHVNALCSAPSVPESYGLVRRSRGGAPLPSREAEGIS